MVLLSLSSSDGRSRALPAAKGSASIFGSFRQRVSIATGNRRYEGWRLSSNWRIAKPNDDQARSHKLVR
jgi:hypothetical protein